MLERIVQINDLSDPKGGASKLAVLAACELSHKGHAVAFITGDDGNSRTLAEAGVDIVALGQKRLLASGPLKALTAGLWNRQAHSMVRQWIAENDSPGTAYHLHGWAQILSPSIFDALAPVRERLLISAHDFFLACPNGAFAMLKTGEPCTRRPLGLSCLKADCDRKGRLQKSWRSARHAVLQRAYRPAASPPVLAIHHAMHEQLMRGGIPGDSIITLPNPVEPYSHERIEAEKNGHVLFVGRLEETKGADLAAAAAAAAGAKLIVVGDGPLADRIRQLHPEADLVGRRSAEEIRAYAAQSRLLVMPSRYPEPFGLVAIEAAWSGLPVILSPTALLSQDLVRVGAAIAVDPRDTLAFADAIRSVMQNDDRARQMSEAAHSRTGELALSVPRWAEQIEHHLRNRIETTRAEIRSSCS